MSVQLVNLYRISFGNNVTTLLQDRGGKISPFAMSGKHEGKQASPVDQYAAVEAQKVTTRFEPMPRIDGGVDRPWVFPSDYDLPQLVDTLDKAKVVLDPKSAMVQNAANAMRRARDNELRDAFFADRKTGENGSGTTVFGTALTGAGGQNVAVATGAAAAVNMNVAKLKEALKTHLANEVDLDFDTLHCAITATENDSLLNEMQIISRDFNGDGNETPILKEGIVRRFLNINFHIYNRLSLGTDDAAGSSRMIPVWAQSGMYIGDFNELMFDIAPRRDIRSLPWQIYVMGSFGATRLEEKKVVRIWCR